MAHVFAIPIHHFQGRLHCVVWPSAAAPCQSHGLGQLAGHQSGGGGRGLLSAPLLEHGAGRGEWLLQHLRALPLAHGSASTASSAAGERLGAKRSHGLVCRRALRANVLEARPFSFIPAPQKYLGGAASHVLAALLG